MSVNSWLIFWTKSVAICLWIFNLLVMHSFCALQKHIFDIVYRCSIFLFLWVCYFSAFLTYSFELDLIELSRKRTSSSVSFKREIWRKTFLGLSLFGLIIIHFKYCFRICVFFFLGLRLQWLCKIINFVCFVFFYWILYVNSRNLFYRKLR